jgi:hypothetical protein
VRSTARFLSTCTPASMTQREKAHIFFGCSVRPRPDHPPECTWVRSGETSVVEATGAPLGINPISTIRFAVKKKSVADADAFSAFSRRPIPAASSCFIGSFRVLWRLTISRFVDRPSRSAAAWNFYRHPAEPGTLPSWSNSEFCSACVGTVHER